MSETNELTVFWDDRCLDHEPPAGEFEAEWTGRLAVKEPHPDRSERIQNIRHIIEQTITDQVTWAEVSPATRIQLERVHDPAYIDEFKAFCETGGGRLTVETGANEASYPAAEHAAGAAVQAAKHALEHGLQNIPYALVRPSGHHAQPAQADGFCFFNNVAVAAEHVLETTETERVVIFDWDVHHGNGTQECFYERDDVLVIGIHNDHWSWDPEAHPQTGDVDEHGRGAGEGYNLNVPLPPGTGDEGYEYAIDRIVEPVVTDFDPDLIIASAGQDGGTVDPLGRNVLTKDGFEMLGRRVRELAAATAGGRLALIQEGGYQISHLAYATLGVLEGVLECETGIEDPMAWMDEDFDSARRAVDDVADYYATYWPLTQR
ncbi:class II histone deacetylase [Natribaculum luteum]|uniref:Class II histone deacetylase n=1 Tax=Natribaculum luteum TaxID=1586232 RepID=A0ABD5P370_9EURY|nr:class II histone deacetylase [Natribaculum luteum]